MALLYYFLVPGARDAAHYTHMHYDVSTSLVVRPSALHGSAMACSSFCVPVMMLLMTSPIWCVCRTLSFSLAYASLLFFQPMSWDLGGA